MIRRILGDDGRTALFSLAIVSLLLVSGCNGFAGGGLGGSGPGITEPRTTVIDGSPAIVFNYSVNDFADALIQGPSGEVISEGKIEPNQTIAAFPLYSMRPGTYGIIIQQGGETVARKNITFDGADPKVSVTNTTWAGNRLQAVNATVVTS